MDICGQRQCTHCGRSKFSFRDARNRCRSWPLILRRPFLRCLTHARRRIHTAAIRHWHALLHFMVTMTISFHRVLTISKHSNSGFQAKGYSPTYQETIYVGYSVTDNDPDSFNWISGEISVSKQQWTPYEFDIPAGRVMWP